MAHQGRFRLAGHTVWSVRADTKPVSKLPACVWAATARGSSVADDTRGPRGSDSRKHHNNKLQEAPFAGVHVACVNKIGRQCIVSIDSAAISRSNVIFPVAQRPEFHHQVLSTAETVVRLYCSFFARSFVRIPHSTFPLTAHQHRAALRSLPGTLCDRTFLDSLPVHPWRWRLI
jgi:hypothetical protein